MSTEPVVVSADWLSLREAADAAARAGDLVDLLRLPARDGATLVYDLGCGTGSMSRWLAPRLTGRQHWIMVDRDARLLAGAAADPPLAAADGAPVTVETRQADITRLDPEELAGTGLITASALLDMLTADEVEHFVAGCASAGCPVLITLSVTGGVELAPADPLDRRVAGAFNDHQRRSVGGRRLLGPEAVESAVAEFRRRGFEVTTRQSPWRLGPDDAPLTTRWLAGWLGAGFEQRPDLAVEAAGYARRRTAAATAGALAVTVQHVALLATPDVGRRPG